MTLIKEWATLISALFKNKPDQPLRQVEMKYVLWPGYVTMAWAGLLITRPGYKLSDSTINHEDIHRQQALVLGSYWKFYWRYIWEYIGNFFIFWSFSASYNLISFECQAYGNQDNLGYKVTADNMKLYKFKVSDKKRLWKENKHRWKEFCKQIEP